MMPIGQTAPRLGPESAGLLRLLDLHLSAAEQALTPPQTEDEAQDVQAARAYTDDLFADLVGCWELDGFSAQAVERVLVTPSDSGQHQANYSELVGAAAAAISTYSYHRESERGLGNVGLTNGMGCGNLHE